MIGFACPWCDYEVRLTTQAFAKEAVVCAECNTHVDLSAGPAAAATSVDPALAGLPLAA